MDICVFGAGSLGSLVGGLLAEAHEVTLVGREPHMQAVRGEGLRLTVADGVGGGDGEGVNEDRTVRLETATAPPRSGDIALVTVKSYDTAAAAQTLGDCDYDAVVSLQNGMGNEEILAEHCQGVLAGTCTYGARLRAPGHVEMTGRGTVALGSPEGGLTALAERVAEALAAGLDASAVPDMPRRRWEKLAVNAGINAITGLARIPNGEIVDGPAAEIAAQAAAETARVAESVGVDIADAPERMREVAARTRANTSSMRQDIEAGRRTEIDAINGYVVDRSTEPVPVNETLTALVRAWERGAGVRTES